MIAARLFAPPVLALALSSVACTAATPTELDDETASEAVRAKSDADVKAEIEAAAQGILYMSESDYPFTYVEAKLEGQTSVTQALVREKLASYVDGDPNTDKPLAELYAMNGNWPEWKREYLSCTDPDAYPSPEDCAKMKKLNDALEKNLRGVKVIYFGRDGSRGRVDGVGVSIFIVGRTPQGNLAGVRTIAIWT